MINKYKINTGASVKDYNKVSDWLSFEIPNKINISSGKVDIGQHISTTLALICSRELGIDINSIFVNKLNTDITPNEGITASSLSVGDTSFSIIDPSNGYLVYQIDGVEKLRISNSGYIGFGTNNPQAPIDIRYTAGLQLGSTGGELTITESSDDILFKNTVQDKDLIFNINAGEKYYFDEFLIVESNNLPNEDILLFEKYSTLYIKDH